MLAQVNDRESNAPYEHVLCPARSISHMDFVRTIVGYRRKAGTHTMTTVSRIVFNFYGKTRSETYQLTAFYQLC